MISPETGEAIRLDDEIGPMIEEGRRGIVVILGGPGSGKTTALRHIHAILPPWARRRVQLLEVLDLADIAAAGPDALVILALDSLRVAKPGYENVFLGYANHEFAALDYLLSPRRPSVYRLARWDQDDAIEYLLATDREACASVMGRLGRAGDFDFLGGIPELCSVVLDRMARDETIGDVRTALRYELTARIGSLPSSRERIEDCCLNGVRRNGGPVLDLPRRRTGRAAKRPPRIWLASFDIAPRPCCWRPTGSPPSSSAAGSRGCWPVRYPRDLLLEVARRSRRTPRPSST